MCTAQMSLQVVTAIAFLAAISSVLDSASYDSKNRRHHRTPGNETRGRESLKKCHRLSDGYLDRIKAHLARRDEKIRKKYATLPKPKYLPPVPDYDPPRPGEPKSLTELNKDILPFMFQVDILLTPEQLDASEASEKAGRTKRKVTSYPAAKWPTDNVAAIKYYFRADITAGKKTKLKNALNFWEANACVKFEESTTPPTGSSLTFVNGNGCSSGIGKYSSPQTITIADGCEGLGHATHEIGHALGFFHEQMRYDRDTFVTVNMANVQAGKEHNYALYTSADMNTYGVTYEYGSVMSYADEDFAINDTIPTVVAKQAGFQNTMGNRIAPSFVDVLTMNMHYNCTARCDPCKSAQCLFGGYPNPKDCSKCRCPTGFGGPQCADLPPAINAAGCGGKSLPATNAWQTLSATVGPATSTDATSTCFWHITAPANMLIQTNLTLVSGSYCSEACFWTAVELKNMADFQPTGKRHCCREDFKNAAYTSESNLVSIIAYAAAPDRLRFDVQYRYVQNPSPPITTTTLLPRCTATTTKIPTTTTTIKPTTTITTKPTTTLTTKPTTTTTLKPTTTTTTKPTTTTTKPTTATTKPTTTTTKPTTPPITTTTKCPTGGGVWSAWSAWTACSQLCGGCGEQVQKRNCTTAAAGCPCTGSDFSARHCNSAPCRASYFDKNAQCCTSPATGVRLTNHVFKLSRDTCVQVA